MCKVAEILHEIESTARLYGEECHWVYDPFSGQKRQPMDELPLAIKYRATVLKQRVDQLFELAESLEENDE